MGEVLVTVEPVESKAQLRRFADIPFLLHGADPRWSPPVRAYESWRLDARRHPYFDRADAAFLLARQAGRPVGRIAAHLAAPGDPDGRFGFFDAPDSATVVSALVRAAREWLVDQGATSMTGPVSWTPDEDFGVPVLGAEQPGLTGRAWRPPWYAERLLEAGLAPRDQRRSFRLATADAAVVAPEPTNREAPPHAGGYADPALVLENVAAVPDVTDELAGATLRSAWRVARRARERQFETAVCVRCSGDPAVEVPRLLAAAQRAGYEWLVAPWAPAGVEPETIHQVFALRL